MSLIVETLHGETMVQAVDQLAQLRVHVFRAFPYLYEGSESYERDYLNEFSSQRDAVLVVARDESRVVGAATASPLAGQHGFAQLFQRHDIDPQGVFYFGESVLMEAYRGQGIGHAFFDHREHQAQRVGARYTAFCAVIRTENHPARPSGYRPLDPFWRQRGYAPIDGLIGQMSWPDIGDRVATDHDMQFWVRRLKA